MFHYTDNQWPNEDNRYQNENQNSSRYQQPLPLPVDEYQQSGYSPPLPPYPPQEQSDQWQRNNPGMPPPLPPKPNIHADYQRVNQGLAGIRLTGPRPDPASPNGNSSAYVNTNLYANTTPAPHSNATSPYRDPYTNTTNPAPYTNTTNPAPYTNTTNPAPYTNTTNPYANATSAPYTNTTNPYRDLYTNTTNTYPNPDPAPAPAPYTNTTNTYPTDPYTNTANAYPTHPTSTYTNLYAHPNTNLPNSYGYTNNQNDYSTHYSDYSRPAISELIDKRPAFHPYGPRSQNSPSISPQPKNGYISPNQSPQLTQSPPAAPRYATNPNAIITTPNHSSPQQPQFTPDDYGQWNDSTPVQVPKLSPGNYQSSPEGRRESDSYSDNEDDGDSFVANIREELNSKYLSPPSPVPPLEHNLRLNIPTVITNTYQSDPYSTPKDEANDYFNQQTERPDLFPKRLSLPPQSNRVYQDRRQSNIIDNIGNDRFHSTLSTIASSSFATSTTTNSGIDMVRSTSDVSKINKRLPPITPSSHISSPEINRSHTTSSGTRTGLVPPQQIGDFDSSFRSSTRSTDDELMIKLNLPSIPDSVPVFDATRLSSRDYEKCREIWSLSSVSRWIASFFQNDGLQVSVSEVTRALIGLFTHHIPTLNWLQAELVAENYIKTLKSSSFIVYKEEPTSTAQLPLTPIKQKATSPVISVNTDITITGVFPILTGSGCYSKYSHNFVQEQIQPYRCYSSRCSRTLVVKAALPEIDINDTDTAKDKKDWALCYNIDEARRDEIGTQEVKRQYAIHELIVGEESFVSDLNILVSVYGDSLQHKVPQIMNNQDKFYKEAFNPIKKVVKCHNQYLLSALKHRQKQQAPCITGIADIVLEWLKHCREPYDDYANCYPYVGRQLDKEKENNQAFINWLELSSRDSRAKGCPHSFYFHRTIPRVLRYTLLLGAIKKYTRTSSQEYELLERCIEQCESLGHSIQSRFEELEKSLDLLDLSEQIVFTGLGTTTDLRLTDGKRRIIKRGDVLRKSEHNVDWVSTHLILLDNYLLLGKRRPGTNKLVVSKKVSLVVLFAVVCN